MDILLSNNFILIICVALLLFILLTIPKIKQNKKSIIYYLPLFAVITISISIYVISSYYQNRFDETIAKYELLVSMNASSEIDSISSEIGSKAKVLDSLKRIDSEYSIIIKSIENQQRIIGDRKTAINNVLNSKAKTQTLISQMENYNDIIEASDIPPHKGYTVHGETSNFTLYPPTNRDLDYLDFGLVFNNDNIVSRIECIYIEVIREEGEKKYREFSQYYLPQKNINMFRIKNYLKNINTTISIGYFTKKSFENNEYPVYEYVKLR